MPRCLQLCALSSLLASLAQPPNSPRQFLLPSQLATNSTENTDLNNFHLSYLSQDRLCLSLSNEQLYPL